MADQKKPDKKKSITPYKSGRECPKCQAKMADHADRYTCGKCGYTEFKPKN